MIILKENKWIKVFDWKKIPNEKLIFLKLNDGYNDYYYCGYLIYDMLYLQKKESNAEITFIWIIDPEQFEVRNVTHYSLLKDTPND